VSDTDRRVDELREQLRSLGYLDARVDRFVLGGAGRTRPVGLVLGASARIGILAGLLLGPSAAIGLRARVPELVTGVGDAIVLAMYLALLFGAAATLVAAVAITAGAWAARKSAARPDFARLARRAATTAGMAVGVSCLLYLTLWWRTTTGLAGGTSLGWSFAVLAVAVAISLLLGHAVAVTVLAVLARLGYAAALGSGRPLSSFGAIVPMGLVALAGAIALLVATAASGRAASEPPPLTVVPTSQRVVVIAVDGVDAATVTRLRSNGRLPAFDRLLGQAVASLPSDADRDPARVWTTIATGQSPERHGIRALETRQVAGLTGRLHTDSPGWAALAGATDLLRLTQPAIASGGERLIPAFWEVAARAGLRTATIHWWATWPASDDGGITLTDRAILRLEHGGALDGEISPASLYEPLRREWPERRQRAAVRAARALVPEASSEVSDVIRRSADLDATLLDLARDPALGAPDLLVVYLPGLDIAQHALFGSADRSALAASGAAERVASLDRYYEFLDEEIAALAHHDPISRRLTLLVTQPGRVPRAATGILAMSGIPAASISTTADVTAIAPTVLHALGVPVADDLAGRPALQLFAGQFGQTYPVRRVATYGSRQPAARSPSSRPLDREMVERMRSLGYVR